MPYSDADLSSLLTRYYILWSQCGLKCKHIAAPSVWHTEYEQLGIEWKSNPLCTNAPALGDAQARNAYIDNLESLIKEAEAGAKTSRE